jgi:hypothetical protein
LPFERSLLRKSSFKRVLVRPVIDFKQRFALLHELVVAHIQAGNPAFHLWRDPDEIGKYFSIIGPGIVVRTVKHDQPQDRGRYHNASAEQAAKHLAGFLTRLRMHGPSLLEEDKPQRECEQSSQTGISQYWEREHNLKAQQQPAGHHREQQTQCQARKPSREEGPQNVKGRSPSAARQHKRS